MARLIIGHTTRNSSTIWVRGDYRYSYGFVTVTGPAKNQTKHIALEERHGFTGALTFKNLKARTRYNCNVSFGDSENTPVSERIDYGHCTGKILTFPPAQSNTGPKFLLGSCNLHSLGILQNPDKVFRRLGRVADREKVDFMIHCGDQIYYEPPIKTKGYKETTSADISHKCRVSA